MNSTDLPTQDSIVELIRKLVCERDYIISALEAIEDTYMDGSDTHADWMAMGEIASAALAEIKKP